jgi:AAA family ATP:ADP antiporter
MMVIFRWLNVNVIRPAEQAEQKRTNQEPPVKAKMSLRQNFLYLARSKYLICIALIVIAYNIAMNLIEIVWKNQMKGLYPNPLDYNTYMGQVMTIMGIIATLAGLFTTSNVIRRFSWTSCALIPTVVIGASGAIFFATVLLEIVDASWVYPIFGVAPLTLSVTLGSLQNCLSRASKYTVFDATKEIAFIPLSNDAKLKGKAAIDGVGSRLGKSGGSIIHQGLLLIFSTVAASAPYVAIIFLGAIVIWGLAVTALGKQFDQLIADNAKLDIPEPVPTEPVLVKG